MSRFARVTEEVLLRHKELAVERHKTNKMGKSALETLYLYQVILLHSWESPYCKKNLPELCETYGLNLKNSYRRLKILREKGWIENTKKHIRPLLIHSPGKSKSVTVTTNLTPEKSVTVTPKIDGKGVTVTPEKCNSYTKIDGKGVTVTPENDETSIPANDYGDSKTFLNLNEPIYEANNNTEKVVVVGKTNGHKSQFSIEEVRRYVALCAADGQMITNRFGLETYLFETGEKDALILARLYPEQPSAATAPPDKDRREALEILLDLRAAEMDIGDLEHYYAPDVWAWLMEELKNVERN